MTNKNYATLYKALDVVKDYLSKFIKVERFAFDIPLATSCGDITQVSNNNTGTHTDKDLIIIVKVVNSEANSGMASLGKVCHFDSTNHNRPVLGRIDMNHFE